MTKRTQHNKEKLETNAPAFQLPTDEQFTEANEVALLAQEEDKARPMSVQGLDEDEYCAAIIDLTLSEKMQNFWRESYRRKGFVRLEGKPVVNGCSDAEVWVQKMEVQKERLAAKKQRFEDDYREGRRFRPMAR